MEKRRLYSLIALALLALTAIYYFIYIKFVPGGIFPDAAANGLDANLILDGQHQPFFPRGNGREALFFYLMAGSIALFGVNHWSILIPGVLVAILTIWGVYKLASLVFNQKVGLVAMIMTSVSYWLFIISRSGFRAILMPMFLVFFLYFLFLAIKQVRYRWLWASLSGLMFGLGFYSYIAYRMVLAWPVFFIFLLIVSKISGRKKYSQYAKIGWYFILFSILALIPLGIYFAYNPEAVVGRAGQVSIFSPELNQGDLIGTLIEQVKVNFFAFWSEGDLNWRHNISGWSLFDPLTGVFLIGGLVFFFIKSIQFIGNLFSRLSFKGIEYFMILVTFLLLLVPAIMSPEGAPHALRLIGCLPFATIMAGWFLVALFELFSRSKNPGFNIFSKILIAGSVAFILIFNITSFWTVAATDSDYYHAFRKDLTYASQYLNERSDRDNTYLALDEYSLQTPEFLTSINNQPYIPADLDKLDSLRLLPDQQIVFTLSTLELAERFEEFHPKVEIVRQEFNQLSEEGEELIRVYER